MFQVTTAIQKLLKLKNRKRIIQGGSWAGKTFGIIPCLIQKAQIEPNKIITIVAESIPAIKHGALANFEDIMQDTKRWVQANYNSTERTYKFPNGSEIQFTSFDTIGKAKAAGKRHDLFINEANYISFEIADALMFRTEENIWIDYNPVESFWAHEEILPQEDAEFLLLKHTDNECLPETIKKELLMKIEKAKTSAYWANWCRVYIDGEIGSLEGIIFKDKKLVEKFPENCKWIVYGMDFGYTNDPSTLVKVGLHDGELFFEEIFYRTGLTNQDIIRLLRQKNVGRTEIIADSSEPKSIREIQLGGFNMRGAEKGKDSIVNGIDLLHRFDLNIVNTSMNLINEFRKYSWDIDKKTGKSTNDPVDLYNHCIDPIRYAVSYKFHKPIQQGAPASRPTSYY